mgnify:CR=1 FL=1|tara:strand:- start:3361 stop:3570 length:210 start_codon:yes stop_codon:yes gene_type:complete
MRVEGILLGALMATLFSFFVFIPVVFIYGVWNVALSSILGLPTMNMFMAFLTYVGAVGLFTIIRKSVTK